MNYFTTMLLITIVGVAGIGCAANYLVIVSLIAIVGVVGMIRT